MVERGEKGGVVLDQGSEGEGLQPIEDAGGSDAPVTIDPKVDKVVPEQSGETDLNGGAENPPVGEDDQVQEGEVPEDGEVPGPKNDDRLSSVEKTLREIHEKINAPKPEPETKPLSEEDWAKLEQEWGVPRSAIERQTQQSVKVVKHLTDYIDSKFAKLEFSGAFEEFSKTPGFQDAIRYKKDVMDFLGTYDAKHWANPEILKRAVIYSRGLNANSNLQRARTDAERNRKIAGPARPAAPGGSARKPAAPALTQAQKEAAALMPGGEQEYIKYRVSGGRRIIE